MSQRGKPSTAHVFDNRDQCLYCHMYKVNVDNYVHECTAERERITDALDRAAEQKVKDG